MDNTPDNSIPEIEGQFVRNSTKHTSRRIYSEKLFNTSLKEPDVIEGEQLPSDSHNIADIYGTLNRAFNCYREQNAKKEEIKKRRKLKKLIKRQKKHHK